MVSSRGVLAGLGAGLIAAMAGVWLPVQVEATGGALGDPNCPHGGNYLAAVCFYGNTQIYDATRFNNEYLYAAPNIPSGGHINNTIWAYSGSPCTSWVEVGLTEGYHKLSWYGVYDAANVGGIYSDAFQSFQSVDGSNHLYALIYNGSGMYTIQYDSTVLNVLSGLGNGTCIAEAGLEEAKNHPPDNTYHADTFDDTPLAWTDTNGGYHPQWSTGQFWVDYLCGWNGNVTPNCLEGVQYSNTHWAANKQ